MGLGLLWILYAGWWSGMRVIFMMAIPNMIALFALSGVIVKETKAFFAAEKHKM